LVEYSLLTAHVQTWQKLIVVLLCVCVHSAWKGRPRSDLYCVVWDVKPYSLTHLLTNVADHQVVKQSRFC